MVFTPRWKRKAPKRRNLILNSVCAGLSAGTPGSLPRGWTSFFPDVSNGITTQVIGAVNENGIDCFDWRISGTPTGGGGTASYRSNVGVAYGARTNTTINKPGGATTGDTLVMMFLILGNPTAPTVTAPAGWTDRGSPGSYIDGGGFQGVWHIYTKPATGSEPANYTFTHAAASTEAEIYCVTGADATTPVIFGTLNQSFGTTTSFNSLTTTRNNTVIIAWGVGWDTVAGATAPTGTTPTFTLRETALTITTTSDGVLATAGATGTKQITTTGSNSADFGLLVGVQPSTGTANGNSSVIFENNTDIPGVSGEALTVSAYVKLVAGAIPTALSLQFDEVDAGQGYLTSHNVGITPTSTMKRFQYSTVANQPTCAFLRPCLAIAYTTTLDMTLRIGLPQAERGMIMSLPERRLSI